MAELVSRTYSEALFEVALEMNAVKEVQSEFAFLIGVFQENPDFFELIKTPKISMVDKKELLIETFGTSFSEHFINFLKIIIDKHREVELPWIKKAFDERVDAHFNVLKATVESVVPLSDLQINLLSKNLSQISSKEVSLENVVNKDLIGGIVVTIGDRVIDGSIKYKLETMLESLTQIII